MVEDADAPGGTYVHWVVFGLDPGTDGLEAGARLDHGRQGKQQCRGGELYRARARRRATPPHRYVFSIYALREPIDADDGASAETVREQVREKALATGRLTGRFGR